MSEDKHVRVEHPKITINNAQRRLLDTVRNSKVYEIVKYEVWMCDELEYARGCINDELKEKGIELPKDYDLEIYIEVAQFDVAKEQLIKTLERNSLTEKEKQEISMLNTLYPIQVQVKGALLKEFEL